MNQHFLSHSALFSAFCPSGCLFFWVSINEVCCHCASTETVGAGKAGERVPGLASGDLSIWQGAPDPPVSRHHACLQWRRSVYIHIFHSCTLKKLHLSYHIWFTKCWCCRTYWGKTHETQTLACFPTAELHLASYESEGPENNMEKDSRRSLRWVFKHVHTKHLIHYLWCII